MPGSSPSADRTDAGSTSRPRSPMVTCSLWDIVLVYHTLVLAHVIQLCPPADRRIATDVRRKAGDRRRPRGSTTDRVAVGAIGRISHRPAGTATRVRPSWRPARGPRVPFAPARPDVRPSCAACSRTSSSRSGSSWPTPGRSCLATSRFSESSARSSSARIALRSGARDISLGRAFQMRRARPVAEPSCLWQAPLKRC